MPRCSPCSSGVRARGNGVARTWTSFDELESSADSRCDFCSLCRQYLSNWNSRKQLCETPGDVRLYAHDDHFTLECPSFHGQLILHFEVLEKPRQAQTVSEAISSSCQGFLEDAGSWLQQCLHVLMTTKPPEVFLEVSRSWLQRCLNSHQICNDGISWTQHGYHAAASNLPRRLVDLMHNDAVKVIDCKDWLVNHLASPAELREYCTLSYRWGQTTHDYVLKASFNTFLEMPLTSMPQTFKDAFAVVRALGVRFLWIDALCIVQPSADDDSDWQAEGPRMGTIYQNSILTIAATCALHAHQGFLAQTGNSVFTAKPCIATRLVKDEYDFWQTKEVLVKASTPGFFQCVSNSTLNERGWVMQERALSKRVVHFTEHGIFWECGAIKAHNVYGDLGAQLDRGACRHKEGIMSVARSRRTQHLCPVEWFHFVKHYSYAQFTHPRDRLMALSSVARAVQPVIGADYLAGLWRNDLLRGLEWHCFKPEPKPRTHKAPTWSWASVGSGVEFTVLGMDTFSHKVAEVIDAEIQPSPGNDHYGEISKGRLKLRGTLDYVRLPETSPEEYDRHLGVYWDEIQSQPPALSGWKEYIVLPLGGHSAIGMTLGYRTMFAGLILEPIGDTMMNSRGVPESTTREYRRIGWVEYDCPIWRQPRIGEARDWFNWWKVQDATDVAVI